VADFLEIQSADRTGWLTVSEPQPLSQDEVEIQTIYSYLQLVDTSPLISEHVRGPVYKLFPPSVRSTIRAHIACRHWIISKITAQGIGRRTRQSRIELFLHAIEISRSRSQGVFVDGMGESPVVRSFVETVLTSALLSPQSRLFTRVWQDVAANRGASVDSFETFISTPLASVTGRKPTVDFGWLLERMIEIISLPDTLQDGGCDAGLVNFEKRRCVTT
jgi:GTPase-activating protein BEM2